MKDSLGSRMKGYEGVTGGVLTRRLPVIIRLDGKSFHTFTKGMRKPFDEILIETMQETAYYLSKNIQGCKIAYVQSDEISLMLTDYDTLETDAWFGNKIQKIVSVSASMATMVFNRTFRKKVNLFGHYISNGDDSEYFNILAGRTDSAMFDSRVFTLPKEEVVNYFIWRQKDAIRNSIQMLGQSEYSHKELNKKSCEDIKDMLKEKGIDWDMLEKVKKHGTCIIQETESTRTREIVDDAGVTKGVNKWKIDREIPEFTQDREYINKLI